MMAARTLKAGQLAAFLSKLDSILTLYRIQVLDEEKKLAQATNLHQYSRIDADIASKRVFRRRLLSAMRQEGIIEVSDAEVLRNDYTHKV